LAPDERLHIHFGRQDIGVLRGQHAQRSGPHDNECRMTDAKIGRSMK
jgi:hypothetical protein